MRRATAFSVSSGSCPWYFYPRSPCGERPRRIPQAESQSPFLSTLSLRRATRLCAPRCTRSHISIHALLAESDGASNCKTAVLVISIHALLAESDSVSDSNLVINFLISIHALLAESDYLWHANVGVSPYFYPRSPCGERQGHSEGTVSNIKFLSTLSLRRATTAARLCQEAPLVYFYPRSPCGERLCKEYICSRLLQFLSTLSLRRATQQRGCFTSQLLISIHALLAESDA